MKFFGRKKGKEGPYKNKSIDDLMLMESQFRRSRNFQEAIKVLDVVIGRNPNLSSALNNKAGILLAHHQYHEALPCLEKSVASDPSNGQAFNNLGYCYFSTGNFEKAVRCYQEALDLGYTHEGVYYNLGAAYFNMRGAIDEALDQWEATMAINPQYAPLIVDLRKIGKAVGVISSEEPINIKTVRKIRKALKTG